MTAAQSANGHQPAPEHRPADWGALVYQPAEGTPLLTCRCGAHYLNDEPGRNAHNTVFGHQPRSPESAKTPPPQEGTPS